MSLNLRGQVTIYFVHLTSGNRNRPIYLIIRLNSVSDGLESLHISEPGPRSFCISLFLFRARLQPPRAAGKQLLSFSSAQTGKKGEQLFRWHETVQPPYKHGDGGSLRSSAEPLFISPVSPQGLLLTPPRRLPIGSFFSSQYPTPFRRSTLSRGSAAPR